MTLLWLAEAAYAGPSDIAGKWATSGFGSIVELAPCDGDPTAMCGQISWLWEPTDAGGRPRTDGRNPEPAQRARPLVGIRIIDGLRETAPDTWTEGSLYNPDDGRTYTGTVKLVGGTLELTGCALRVFCQTQVWRRPEDVIAAVRVP
ncbi:MAG: DUF2147 domain-containing protein [Myxococcota bacterium]